MKAKFLISVSLGLATLLTSCGKKPENTDSNKVRSLVLWNEMGDALVDRTLLTEIREGRATNAIELLEFSIDCSIVEMEHNSTNFDSATQEHILKTLRLLKEYRQKYPRKEEAVSDKHDESRQNLKTTREAEEILNHISKPTATEAGQ